MIFILFMIAPLFDSYFLCFECAATRADAHQMDSLGQGQILKFDLSRLQREAINMVLVFQLTFDVIDSQLGMAQFVIPAAQKVELDIRALLKGIGDDPKVPTTYRRYDYFIIIGNGGILQLRIAGKYVHSAGKISSLRLYSAIATSS